MTYPDPVIRLNKIWLKATVLGSLWASFEIIVGSFLHNMRLPFAGTFLSAFAVVLLIAFHRVWNDRWIILRAGLICAAMKSISPSAVIFGPMIGILSEAILIEAIIMLLGRNLIAYSLGGALAVLSALIHKAANLILLYGFDLLEIYLNMVNFAASKLHLPESSAVNLVVLISFIYLFIGIIAALAGFYIGNRALKVKTETSGISFEVSNRFQSPPKNHYQPFLLLLHPAFLVSGLHLLSSGVSFSYKIVFAFLYISFCLIRYQKLFRRIAKPLFWVQLLVVLLLASIFLNYSGEEPFSFSLAVTEGLGMLLRAIVVVVAFSSIGRELSNPKILNYTKKKRFLNLYLSVRAGMEVLPAMIEKHSEVGQFFRYPFRFLSRMISEADNWLSALEKHYGK